MVVKKERVRVWGNEKCGLWTGIKKNIKGLYNYTVEINRGNKEVF